jgi:hypothetical protein
MVQDDLPPLAGEVRRMLQEQAREEPKEDSSTEENAL